MSVEFNNDERYLGEIKTPWVVAWLMKRGFVASQNEAALILIGLAIAGVFLCGYFIHRTLELRNTQTPPIVRQEHFIQINK